MDKIAGDNLASVFEHTIGLSDSEWAVWRWAGLRGTGFSINQVLTLASPEASAAADQLIHDEEEAEQLWGEALEAFDTLIGETDSKDRGPFIKAIRLLRKGKIPDSIGADCAAEEAIKRFGAACARADRTWAEFEESFDKASSVTSKAIRQIGASSRFREAITWQNRRALHSGIKTLLQKPEDIFRDNKNRRNEEFIASYWQRYCAKNDSIGFFGPVGWARLVSRPEAINVEAGSSLLAARKVFFEHWCIDALADSISDRPGIRPWVAPYRSPIICANGRTIHIPIQGSYELTEEEAVVFNACDGERVAKEIVDKLLDDPLFAGKQAADIYRLLEDLAARKLISWTLQVRPSMHPEKTLRLMLEGIGDQALRQIALGMLDQLISVRDAVGEAAGDPDRLDKALSQLESTFTSLTGVSSTRDAGKMYAGRTLVYEDCRRDIEVEVGSQVLDALSPPLSLLLGSARWLTLRIAEQSRRAFEKAYQELASETGSRTINSFDFWVRAQRHLYASKRLKTEVVSQFQRLWADVLSIRKDCQSVTYTSKQLKPRVLEVFNAPCPGWQYARYHSPDVMIAASSVDAIKSGDYQLVLGEIHLALHTLSRSLFVSQHPCSEELFKALEATLPQPRIVPVSARQNRTSRGVLALVSPKDYHLEIDLDSPSPSPARALPMGSLVIEDSSDGLIVRKLDSDLRFDIIEVFADLLTSEVMNSFKIFAAESHTPRVTIDRLVVSRESWLFAPSDLSFAFEKSEPHRFLAARRWAGSLGLPRFLFFKSPVEVKPCLLDLHSPIFVNLFSRIIRRTFDSDPEHLISVSEMLPAPDQVWLPDASGDLYSCEFRIVAVDLSAFSAAPLRQDR